MNVHNSNIEFLKEILERIYERKMDDFTGIGIISYSNLTKVPYSNLRETLPPGIVLPIDSPEEIINLFLTINRKDSHFHDGFHLISAEKKLTHLCCYFSPSITANNETEFEFGGRYRAAHYGSFNPDIVCIGVIGGKYGPTIFSNGKKIK